MGARKDVVNVLQQEGEEVSCRNRRCEFLVESGTNKR